MNMKKTRRNHKPEVLDIAKTKDWDRAKNSDKNLYQYIRYHKDTDESCKTIWEHIKTETRDYESEILEIVETKDWDKARQCNDRKLYDYIHRHKDTDEDCKTILEYIGQQSRDYKSEISDIIRTKNWDRAKWSNDNNLYQYVCRHRDTDENCKTICEHISHQNKDFESEILEIVETKDWGRAKGSNDKSLYGYIYKHKDTNKDCRIIWEHIATEKRCPYTIKDCLLDYFKYGKLKNKSLYNWINKRIKRGNQSCIDVKNLIVAAENFQDPVALETLELIKNHLEKEGT
jgi:hypothetical protein